MFPEEEEKTDPSMTFPLATTSERPLPRAEPVPRTITLDGDGYVPKTVTLPSGEYEDPSSAVSQVSRKMAPQPAGRPDLSVGALVGYGALTFALTAGIAFGAVWAILALVG